MNASDLLKHLPDLPLYRLGDESEAGLWSVSLPWPRAQHSELSLDGRPTCNKSLGQWPGTDQNQPRRVLLFADANGQAPSSLSLSGQSTLASQGDGQYLRPTASMELLDRSPHEDYIWEKHWLHLKRGERSLKIAMGLKTGDEVHWWEACRLVVLEETPHCVTIEMGGSIPHQEMTIDEFHEYKGYANRICIATTG